MIGRAKLIFFCGVSVTLLVSWVACATPVTIQFSGWPSGERMEPIIERFHAENPDIRVELHLEGPAKVKVKILGGVPPEIFRVSWAELEDFVNTGAVIDLGPFIERDKAALGLKDFWPPTLASGRVNGVQYGFPMNVGGNLTYVNLDHLSNAGLVLDSERWTYADFAGLAQKATRDVDGDGSPDLWGYSNVNHWAFWTGLIFSNGGSIYDKAETSFALNNPITEAVFAFIEDLVHYRKAAPGPGLAKPHINSAKVTFWLGSAPEIFRLAEAPFEWAVAPNPSGSERRVMMGGNQPLLISKSATLEQQAAAWELIKFISRADTQAWFGNMGWNAPTRISAIPKVKHPMMRVFAYQLEHQVQYTNRLHNEIDASGSKYINATLRGELSPRAAVEQLNRELDALLK